MNLTRQRGQFIDVKNRNKSDILIFFPAIPQLVRELVISNMHNKFEKIRKGYIKNLSRSQIIDVKSQ